MKKLLCYILITQSLATQALASHQSYTFKYKLQNEELEIKKSAATWDVALSFAAQQCFDFYIKSRKLTDDHGLDVIDVCANPNS
jgi:hypothetical protein